MNVANLVDPFGIHVQAGERGLAGCQPAQSPGLEFGRGAGVVAAFDTACVNVDELGQASAELFQQHPDYAIINSVPGLAAALAPGCSLKLAMTEADSPTHEH